MNTTKSCLGTTLKKFLFLTQKLSCQVSFWTLSVSITDAMKTPQTHTGKIGSWWQ